MLGLADGTKGKADVLAFRERYVEQAAAANKFIQQEGVLEKHRFRVAGMQRVSLAQQGIGVLNPGSTKDRKAVNDAYGESLLAKGDATLEERQAFDLDFVAQTGMLPDLMKNTIEGAANSPDPDKRVAGAIQLRRVTNAHPQAARQFNQKAIADATELNTYVDAGASPAEAVEMQEKARSVNDVVKKARQDSFRAQVKDADVASVLSDKFDEGLFDVCTE
jgi:hypothetical protein